MLHAGSKWAGIRHGDSLSINVESLSTTGVEALVVITNATSKSDNLIEIVLLLKLKIKMMQAMLIILLDVL